MIETTCVFTSNRPKSFSWKYNEAALDCVLLKETLATQIKSLADRGVTDFLSGMAQANEVVYVGQEYSRVCMLKRNRYIVGHSFFVGRL